MSNNRQFMFTKFSFIIVFSLKILVVISQQSSVLISSQESKSRYNQKEYNTQVSNINHHNKCEPISIPLCQDIQFYNQTIFPNLLNHARQVLNYFIYSNVSTLSSNVINFLFHLLNQ